MQREVKNVDTDKTPTTKSRCNMENRDYRRARRTTRRHREKGYQQDPMSKVEPNTTTKR